VTIESGSNLGRKAFWLAGAFALCFFVGGFIWWRGSYQDYLDTGFRWETLPLLAGVAIVLAWIIDAGIIGSAVVVGIAFPAIVFGRVVLDCIDDPTRHNLWPFEVFMALVIGMIIAFPAAALGWLLRRITHRSRADGSERRGSD